MMDVSITIMIILMLTSSINSYRFQRYHLRYYKHEKHEKQQLNSQHQHHNDHFHQPLSYYNDPEIEAIRQQLYSNLKNKLFTAVRREGCPSKRGWLKTFEKWQFISKLTESHNSGSNNNTNNINNPNNTIANSNMNAITLYDPLIPCTLPNNNNVAYNKLKEYLGNLEMMPKDGADIIALELTVESYDQVIQIIEFSKSKQLNTKSYDNDVKISYDNSTELFYLSLKKHSKKLHDFLDYKNNLQSMGIASIKIGSMKALYKRWLNTNKQSFENPPPAFYRHLYILLIRYKSLDGYGWQAAIPDSVFELLNKKYNVTTECFASPLNAYLPNYCSVFNDSDKPFGSLGSFFDQKFTEGCYEANPPFTPELFDVMVKHMNNMLDEATGPLSFIIFAPAWVDDPHWALLTNAKYYTYSCIIPSSDHTYCDGAFHKQPKVLDESNASNKYRPAPFDTGIVFYSNAEAIKKWPITREVEEDIRKAYSVAQPSPASLERAKLRGKYIPKSLRPKQ